MMFKQKMLSWSVASALMVMSGAASASGFALIEQSASGLGNAFAGGSAIAEDASTVFFNPAGMSRIDGKQIAVGVHAITPSAKYTSASGVPSGGDAGGTAYVPNIYYVMELKPGLKAGIGLNVPFGLETNYPLGWAGQSQAIKSKLEAINLNPSLSYQVNEALSVGFGVDYQHISGELSNYGGAVLGTSVVKGTDNAWGYNLGALYNVDEKTRLGVAYRSAISYKLSGTVTTSLPFANGPVTLDVKLPDSWSLSAVHKMNDTYEVMADISRTNWSTFKQVNVVNSAGTSISNTIENWKDTMRYSVGATHHYNEQWSARAGLAYDEAPVKDEFRTARIPDNNRTWLALGGQYKLNKDSAVDFGYAHLFVKNSTINSGPLVGSYKNKVDILSAQYTQSF
jgi:long-chain fatty acid transport protein